MNRSYTRKRKCVPYDTPYYFSSYHLLSKDIQLLPSTFDYYPQAAGCPLAVLICQSAVESKERKYVEERREGFP